MRFLAAIFCISILVAFVGCHPAKPTAQKQYVPTEAERTAWPKTLDEAVTNILAGMSDAEKARVRGTKKADLILFEQGWGTGIRNDFGMWRGNTNLVADCHAEEPDGASMVIIEAVWQKLQKP